MQRLFPIRAIGGDVCLMDRDRYLAVLEASPVGFALRGERERQALVLGFARFLNGLTFPVQLLIKTDVVRLDDYLADMKAHEADLEPHLRPALGDYIRFLHESQHLEHLMRRRFYVVLSWQGTDTRSRPIRRGESLWEEAERELGRRAAVVDEGLRPLGIKVRRQGTEELYKFIFTCLNGRDPQEGMSWSWDSGFIVK
jgi:hypothetical protein